LRIVAGALGGRRLVAPRGASTRPTSDRVREALFGILASRGAIEGARVLDLFAGTGALGLEALSRGAEHATFVESGRPALEAIRANVEALGVGDRAAVVASRVEAFARLGPSDRGPAFELVFADPPWRDLDAAIAALETLVGAGGLAPGGLIAIEHAARSPEPRVTGVARIDARRYGDTAIWLGGG
jgi:16S rRNA (guanine(966)-N(2))-methyltransferase RsmD